MIETVKTCPLGAKCEESKDGKIYRCGWLTTLAGRNPQTGEMMDETACGISFMPIMLAEVAQANRATGEAVVSAREENIKRQDIANTLLHGMADIAYAQQATKEPLTAVNPRRVSLVDKVVYRLKQLGG